MKREKIPFSVLYAKFVKEFSCFDDVIIKNINLDVCDIIGLFACGNRSCFSDVILDDIVCFCNSYDLSYFFSVRDNYPVIKVVKEYED